MQTPLWKESPGRPAYSSVREGAGGRQEQSRAVGPCTPCQELEFLPSELWGTSRTCQGAMGLRQSYLHFEMIPTAGRDEGLEREEAGEEAAAIVGEGVQNTSL